MDLKRIRGTSATVYTMPNGTEVLFSYLTPVAVYFPDTGETWRTSTKYSVTTSRQLNEWFRDYPEPMMVDQSAIDALMREAQSDLYWYLSHNMANSTMTFRPTWVRELSQSTGDSYEN